MSRYPVLNFSGGIRRDKSSFELQVNELLDARNVEVDERGRVKSRRGSQQFGQTLSGELENGYFIKPATGAVLTSHFLVSTNASTSLIYKLVQRGRLSADITTASTTISVASTTDFDASGTIEIDGDQIDYTGVTATSFTGVTGISVAHSTGAPVHQWDLLTQSGTALDGRSGLSYGVLNGIVFIVGRAANMKQYALSTSTISDVSAEPSSILLENYRDRLYTAGDGTSGGTNSSVIRTSFCNRGDGTTWTTAQDFFDSEDQNGEAITAYKVLNDRLGIFKTNSIFVYDEIENKQRVTGVGAYNQKVIQRMGDNLVTFCPKGIFVTNLFSAKQIGEPVRELWKDFVPTYDAFERTCTNTFAWTFQDRYFLFLEARSGSNDTVLEYNFTTDAWTAHNDGYSGLLNALSLNTFRFGDGDSIAREAVFTLSSSSIARRLYENVYATGETPPSVIGGDIFVDLRSNTSQPISSYVETALYDLAQPNLWKTVKNLRVYSEVGQWTVEYRVEDESGRVSAYRPLGTTRGTNYVFALPSECAGYRIGLRLSATSFVSSSILNGFVFEKITLSERH